MPMVSPRDLAAVYMWQMEVLSPYGDSIINNSAKTTGGGVAAAPEMGKRAYVRDLDSMKR